MCIGLPLSICDYLKSKNLMTGKFFSESTGFPLCPGTSLSLFPSLPPRAVLIRSADRNLEFGGKCLS